MRLRTLHLEQFRSYPKEHIDFSNGDIHVLLGPNGAGKTNILEGIALLSLTKSFSSREEQDLIQWNEEYYRVRAEAVEDTGEERLFEVVSQLAPRKQKACFVNDVKIPISQMVGQLPTVTFLPQDLHLFTGPPAERRRFLDQLLCQVSPKYLQVLSEYQKLLRQRNALLKKIANGKADSDSLSVWDMQLAVKGGELTLARLELIEMLQCTIGEETTALGEKWSTVEINYERKSSERDLPQLQKELQDLFEQYRERDLILQTTSVGPHRDDWHIAADGRNLVSFASRGQQRTAVVALLFLEVSYLELRRGEKPIILLDDVFSELDDNHQSSLLESLEGHQVIITTTHVPKELHDAQVYEVGEGRVEASSVPKTTLAV